MPGLSDALQDLTDELNALDARVAALENAAPANAGSYTVLETYDERAALTPSAGDMVYVIEGHAMHVYGGGGLYGWQTL